MGSNWGIMPVGICTSIPLARVIVHERKQLRKVEGGSLGLLFEQDQPIKNPILVPAKHKYSNPNFVINVNERPRCWSGTSVSEILKYRFGNLPEGVACR